jgi:hypothetical protein
MTFVSAANIRFLGSKIPRFPCGHFRYHEICPALRVGSGIRGQGGCKRGGASDPVPIRRRFPSESRIQLTWDGGDPVRGFV